MKALIVTQEHTLQLKDILLPAAGPYHAVVKILACGICSTTDRELIKGTQPYHRHYPCLLGHEAIGEVISVSDKVRNFKVGDWVTRPVGILPGTQNQGLSSAWGGFAEYGLITDIQAMAADGDQFMNEDYTALRQNVLENGKEIGLKASVLSIALSETYNWCQKLEMQNKTVCINGTGIAGLSIALWARQAGAAQIIVLGRRNERLQLATQLGATDVINISGQNALAAIHCLQPEGVELFVEATGVPSQMEVAIRAVKEGGTLGVYGVAPNDTYELDWKWLPADIRITRHEPQEHLARKEVVQLILAGKVPVDLLMTHQWPLSQFQTGYDAVAKGEVVKAMLNIQEP